MSTTNDRRRDEYYLRKAGRLALRGHGSAEPNPLVGCVIVGAGDRVVGWGYHRRFGEPHAEVNALARAGDAARGATAYVSLEPCSHTGKTPPCSAALAAAGVGRVVIARRDPNPIAAGGLAALQAAGVEVDVRGDLEGVLAIADPFAHRVRSGLPWIVAKWAQTLDGRIATRTGESQWLSGELSRRMVHRERGRVDAILTGIGTVLADDPLLTARDVRVRRVARRLVVDPDLRTPLDANIVTTLDAAPTTIICGDHADAELGGALEAAGVEVVTAPAPGGVIALGPVLRGLANRYDMTNALVEGGSRLLGHLFAQKLVREAWVFVTPRLFADEESLPCASGRTVQRVADGVELELVSAHRRGDDLVARYSVRS
jgi:diaminohydroxyphosphoribosylaminopyrimidine deaminase/5-amino-6-(5-phosphoribosylamino)uracil reductase